MCCQGFFQRVVPFAVTFILGIFAASVVYVFVPVKIKSTESFEKPSVYKKTDCGFDKMKRHHDIDETVIFLDVPPPPPPPAPPVAPEPPLMAPDVDADFEAYPPPLEEKVLDEEIKKSLR